MYSLYLHIPFCQVRCAYCDFNTYAGLDDLMTPYADALAKEIRVVGDATGEKAKAHTIFFGGGTPSLLPLSLHQRIFQALRESFELTPNCEITLEANPGTVSKAYLDGLRELGVNRLSFGVQSSHPHELKLLDRLHLFGDVAQAVTWARQAGFENLNLDVIFGLPYQTLPLWQATVNRVLALGPDHISAYALSLEHGTPLRAWVYRGLLPMPDPDLAAEMYEWASDTLEAQGFEQYEISNWAKKTTENDLRPSSSDYRPSSIVCRHNLQYWRNLPYLGFGAGAHGYANNQRYSDVLAPAAYIARMQEPGQHPPFPTSPAVAQAAAISPDEAMGETMMMGLRLTQEGVADSVFHERFGIHLAEKYPRQIRKLITLKLIEWDGDHLRLTRGGRLLGNKVFAEFL